MEIFKIPGKKILSKAKIPLLEFHKEDYKMEITQRRENVPKKIMKSTFQHYEINFPTIENPYYFQLTSKKHIFLHFSIF